MAALQILSLLRTEGARMVAQALSTVGARPAAAAVLPASAVGWGTLVPGFALGALVGAGAALCFAPMTGDEMRKKLGMRMQGLLRTVDEAVARGADAPEPLTPVYSLESFGGRQGPRTPAS